MQSHSQAKGSRPPPHLHPLHLHKSRRPPLHSLFLGKRESLMPWKHRFPVEQPKAAKSSIISLIIPHSICGASSIGSSMVFKLIDSMESAKVPPSSPVKALRCSACAHVSCRKPFRVPCQGIPGTCDVHLHRSGVLQKGHLSKHRCLPISIKCLGRRHLGILVAVDGEAAWAPVHELHKRHEELQSEGLGSMQTCGKTYCVLCFRQSKTTFLQHPAMLHTQP